jgi:import receptor subunit TOM22
MSCSLLTLFLVLYGCGYVQKASPHSKASPSSRTSSSVSLSSVDSDASVEESLFDRIIALKDIVPPTTRHSISSRISKTASMFKRGSKLVGNVIWVLTTSTLLVGLPLALILEDESKAVAQEKEMLEQQQGAQQMMAPSLYSQSSSDPSQPKALVPPGF